MKNLKLAGLAFALCLTTAAFANDNYRNATFNFDPSNALNYSFGGIQIGATSGTPITDPFATSGTPITDPFAIVNPQTGSTDMAGLLAYMSTQAFGVYESGMYISFTGATSSNNSAFSSTGYYTETNAVVEIVNNANGSVLWSMPLPQLTTTNYTYDFPDTYIGDTVYIRLHISETAAVPYTSFGSSTLDILSQSAPASKQIFASNRSWSHSGMAPVLLQNYPNPVNGLTTITVQNVNGPVSLKIYDVLGRIVADLSNEVPVSGAAAITFDASNLENGTYFYRLQSASGAMIQRAMIVRR